MHAVVAPSASRGDHAPQDGPGTKKCDATSKTRMDGEAFRNYTDSDRRLTVERHYRLMRTNQTVEYVHRMHAKYTPLRHGRMTMREALTCLREYVDASDPDIALPNLAHAYQTAAAMREAGEPEWMQVTGLVHDVGKLMFLWGDASDGQQGGANAPQWGLSGDTWVVGCALPAALVFPQFNILSPDADDARYNTECGMYAPGCGIQSLLFTWGHDEYLYQVLLRDRCTRAYSGAPLLPDEALAMVRLHSAYAWHEGGAYAWAERPEDAATKAAVRRFNQYDLYSKRDEHWDEQVLWREFGELLDRYFPHPLLW